MPVIRLDAVLEVLASPEADPFRGTPIDSLAIRLPAVNDHPVGPTMALQRLSEEAFRRPQITELAEEELHCVVDAVDDPVVEIHPGAADLDVGLNPVPLAGDGPIAQVETDKQLRHEADVSAMHGRIIDAQQSSFSNRAG